MSKNLIFASIMLAILFLTVSAIIIELENIEQIKVELKR